MPGPSAPGPGGDAGGDAGGRAEAEEAEEDDDRLGEQRELMPLEDRLVEIFGMEGALARCLRATADSDAPEEMDVDGQRGRCVTWSPEARRYVVETFDGVLAEIPEENLRELYPPAPEEGGFDLAWPASADASEEFVGLLCAHLGAKGFCVVQTFLSARERAEAVEAAEGEEGERQFSRLQQEIEAGYMGYDNFTKVATMDEDDVEREPRNALETCSRQLTSLGFMMAPHAPGALGFICAGLRRTMIRMSIDKMDEDELFPEALADMVDEESEWSAHIQTYVQFAQCRRASMLFMIDNEGGDLWLYPKDSALGRSIRIPVAPNRLLVFRHDMMEYSYQARGHSLALQTWILDELRNAQAVKEIALSLPTPEQSGLVVINPGPQVPDGPKANVMSLSVRMPGEAWNASQYWLMFASGSDSCSRWPFARWDYEPYYEEGCDSNQTGKSYTCHGGFVNQEQITQFDNDFFGIDNTEAKSMVPGQKMSMEVGYSCLHGAGLTARSLRGRRVGVWYGDVGPDWGSFQTEWGRYFMDVCHTTMSTSMSNAGTAARLSHVFDLKGPISSYDTACSASLVAMNAAHLLMFKPEGGDAEDNEALVTGVNTLLGPSSFIGNCMATMLSHQGRCFTFNRAADGYQRGEGCGSIFIKLASGDRGDEEKRVCALIGTATNQDGRSASLTAPNGPAQQAVIKKSMAFAGINPNTVSIAECHGTGTALGDPIEVGALMAVMHKRVFPIMKTSAKSNIAHLEAGAGVAGLTKCIMMINMATAPPNCHFNVINAHLMVDGYPVCFDTECINTDFSSSYCGVSSFGFGGTNSRADVYGYASKGHRTSIRVELPKLSPPRVLPIGQPVYISGTWSRWSTFERMEGGRTGPYTCSVVLGDTRIEHFQLSCDLGGLETIHPVVLEADQTCQIIGPDWDGKGLHFCIDGRKDQVPAGTVYNIEFVWEEDRKTISWRPSDQAAVADVGDAEGEGHTGGLPQAIGYDCEHRYFLAGSFRKWIGFQELRHVGDGVYEGSFRMGPRCRESFQILRDEDTRQVFYPAGGDAVSATKPNVPLCGPDAQCRTPDGTRRCWVVRAPQHEVVTVQLSTLGAHFSVTVVSLGPGGIKHSRTWEPWEAWAHQRSSRPLHVTGSFNGNTLTPLTVTRTASGNAVHTCEVRLGSDGLASFQVALEADRSLLLVPDAAGEAELLAVDGEEAASVWWITGLPGMSYEIKVDLGVLDRRRMVTWTPVDGKALLY